MGAGTMIVRDLECEVSSVSAVEVLEDADLQARCDRLIALVMRMGSWLTSPHARMLPDHEWEQRFAHYRERLEEVRRLGDELRPVTLRARTEPLSGEALIGEVLELFAA